MLAIICPTWLDNPACIGVVIGGLLTDVIPARIADPEPVDNALTVHYLTVEISSIS
jgi:hypothetical protein